MVELGFVCLFLLKKNIVLVLYSGFNLCHRPCFNALAGDLINIVIWIMNGDDPGGTQKSRREGMQGGTWLPLGGRGLHLP